MTDDWLSKFLQDNPFSTYAREVVDALKPPKTYDEGYREGQIAALRDIAKLFRDRMEGAEFVINPHTIWRWAAEETERRIAKLEKP